METRTIRKKVEIYGGFHNVRAIKLYASEEAYKALLEGDKASFIDRLSNRQRQRLYKHLCGLHDCLCYGGGWKWR